MSFYSLCLCPVSVAVKLNINISKTVYWIRLRVGDEWHLFNSSLLFVSTVRHSKNLSRRPLKVVSFILHFSKECFLLLVFNSKSCCIDLIFRLLVAGLFVLCFYPFVNKNSKWLYGRKEIGTRRLSLTSYSLSRETVNTRENFSMECLLLRDQSDARWNRKR